MSKLTYIASVMVLLFFAFSGAYSQSADRNYIVTHTYTSSTAYNDVIQYYDGLGRPEQTVRKQFTPGGKDLVIRQDYDSFGREWRTWLPVSNNNSNGNFDSTTGVSSAYSNDAYPYSEIKYESSPLNRVDEQYGPGQAWRNNSRRVKTKHIANAASGDLACAKYSMENSYQFRRSGYYEACQLYVTQITDEDNNISYEFKDKLGQVLLERRMDGTTRYDTYYIYDDFGNLCRVLPPMASDLITTDGVVGGNSHPSEPYYYAYVYDHRNRLIFKYLSGTYQEYVYDRADRLVFHQTPAIENAGAGRNWLFYKYDGLGRQVMTGIYNGDIGSDYDENERAYHMQYRWRDMLSKESRSDSSPYGYTWTSFPTDLDSVTVTQVNYYDNYDYVTDNDRNLLSQEKTGYDTPYTSAKGLLTGTKSRILDGNTNSSQWITTIYYYDYKGNVVQKRSTNQLGGYDYEYYAYNYNNLVTKKYIEHITSYQSTVKEEYAYSYDAQLRLKTVTHRLDGAAAVTIAQYSYNNLGQVETTTTGGQEAASYAYNLRGWLESQVGTRFEENLTYTTNAKSGGKTCFSGNISSLRWKTPAISSSIRGYSFEYDAMGMLKKADYGETANLSANTQRYSESFSFDKHGNPLTINRYGRKGSGFDLIDNLAMPTYIGNRLREVVDHAGDQNSADLMEFKDGINNPGEEYIYNCAGALMSDYNKKICMFRYNYLLLPQSVQFRNGNRIEYAYDAAGMKRTVRYKKSNRDLNYYPWDDRVPAESDFLSSPFTKSYTGNKVYENNSLKLILTENGYIEKTGNTYSRYYYLQDHLGNNRVVMNASGTVVQATNYYPSGVTIAESPARTDQGVQPYKFGGKELDRTEGLDFYDYEARPYDPLLMRFTVPDPLQEKYYAFSQYAYCMNNPVNYIDLHGDSVDVARLIIHDNTNNTSYTQTLTNDLQAQTGLTVSVSANGQMTYTKDANGNPIIATTTDANGNVIQRGSATARTQLMGLIDNQSTVSVGISNKGSQGGGSDIWLDPGQINSFINGATGVDNKTLGWGMTFLHESYHTMIGGGLSDSPYNPGPVVNNMNTIRAELNALGGDYGQRLDYRATPIGGNTYIPFIRASKESIILGLPPSRIQQGQKYIKF